MGPDSRGGTYSLLLRLDEQTALDVGALGGPQLEAGWYAYTGSALGPGGFARVDRHRRVASEGTDNPHWHVDYLLEAAAIESAYTLPGADAECAVARALPGERIQGFGASDCDCGSHLAFDPGGDAVREGLAERYGEPV